MIPVSEPVLGEREYDYIKECLTTGWISSSGRFIEGFEQAWASYCGRSYGVAVSNGTVALQLALATLELDPGDEVIMPSFTIISCALAALYCGAVPVLIDADPETWCMDVTAIEERITPRTRAIMPVHIYGHPVDMGPLMALADKHGLVVVEDAAEAHGAQYRSDQGGDWLRCGSFGAMSCFSFYANKAVTTGEGGMILTDSRELAERAKSLRNLAFGPRRFIHEALGFNFRMTNLQAAIGLAQTERIEEIIAKKRSIGKGYTERLQGVRGLRLPIEREWAKSVWWMYGLVLEDAVRMDAAGLAAALRERGVETRPFFVGMHAQPALRARGLFAGESFPVTDHLSEGGLYLPSGLSLTWEQMDAVVDAVREVLA